MSLTEKTDNVTISSDLGESAVEVGEVWAEPLVITPVARASAAVTRETRDLFMLVLGFDG